MYRKRKNSIISSTYIIAIFIFIIFQPVVHSQDISDSFLDRFFFQFESSTDKLIQLAEAMPEESYHWSPDEEAMSVARVFMHIARYNYVIPSNWLDAPLPENIDLSSMEEIRSKEKVLSELHKSIDYVNQHVRHLTKEDLMHPTVMFGQETERWATLFMLMTHMSEHLGQAISYARMNDVVPPWSN